MDEVEWGPVGYLVVEYPGAKMTGEGLRELVALTERGTVRVLDLAFVMKAEDGTISALAIADLDGDGELDLAIFEGASSDLLGEDDLREAGNVLTPGSAAAVLLYENRWAAPFVSALRRSGAELVAAGFIPLDDLAEALDAAEAAS
ncbi:DUF1269 domain-containing protein [Aeromicrobium sp. Marseille-Q0843]|uniref:DUF1269 domain-containing protein n=1 Tax=Aeromicrobium phoceense TaxID=2754045 RepID=A0A838XPW0_9ACTN|nr:DUF6325 family protein [Aeromicrobium phoceense]MBA4609054.1 DUF1269 domain-containing protein [Aeromicrobium phoceense]